jgi:hypothetical protein
MKIVRDGSTSVHSGCTNPCWDLNRRAVARERFLQSSVDIIGVTDLGVRGGTKVSPEISVWDNAANHFYDQIAT